MPRLRNNDEMDDRRLEEREIVKKILPDAIICANDNLAVGVCNRAEALGLSVPKDFKVTGFDNFDKAAYYTPRITTVSRIRENRSCGCRDHVEYMGGKQSGYQLLYRL